MEFIRIGAPAAAPAPAAAAAAPANDPLMGARQKLMQISNQLRSEVVRLNESERKMREYINSLEETISGLENQLVEIGNMKEKGSWFEYVSDTRKEQVIVQNINDWRHLHKMVRELEIAEDACNDMTDDLVISGFTNLRSIVVKKDAMMNLNSLKICDCDVLESIIVEDGSGWDDDHTLHIHKRSMTCAIIPPTTILHDNSLQHITITNLQTLQIHHCILLYNNTP